MNGKITLKTPYEEKDITNDFFERIDPKNGPVYRRGQIFETDDFKLELSRVSETIEIVLSLKEKPPV